MTLVIGRIRPNVDNVTVNLHRYHNFRASLIRTELACRPLGGAFQSSTRSRALKEFRHRRCGM